MTWLSSSSSSTLDDSLFTVYNTPRSPPNIEYISTSTHFKTSATLNLGNIAFQPEISKHTESFLDLPPQLALTPTYHIREVPHSMNIIQFFRPLGQKCKVGTGEERGAENINLTIKPNTGLIPSPKCNKMKQWNYLISLHIFFLKPK